MMSQVIPCLQTIYIKYTLKASQMYKTSLLIISLSVNPLKLPQFYDIILLELISIAPNY